MSSVIGENETNDGMRHPPSAPKLWRAAEPRHNEITPTKGVPLNAELKELSNEVRFRYRRRL